MASLALMMAEGDKIKMASVIMSYNVRLPIREGVLLKRSSVTANKWHRLQCVLRERNQTTKLYFYACPKVLIMQETLSLE